jgi:hypothetical protein
MTVAEIMKAINPILESNWSREQVVRGKWFEIQSTWAPKTIQTLVVRYRGAGWSVSRQAELTQKCTRIFLVIGHPSYYGKKLN